MSLMELMHTSLCEKSLANPNSAEPNDSYSVPINKFIRISEVYKESNLINQKSLLLRISYP